MQHKQAEDLDYLSSQAIKQETEVFCLVPGCGANLTHSPYYLRRHRVCEVHMKSKTVVLDGQVSRFCQQCGKFQPLSDFNGDRKSCDAALKAHNARRRQINQYSAVLVSDRRARGINSGSRRSLQKVLDPESSLGVETAPGRISRRLSTRSATSLRSAQDLMSPYSLGFIAGRETRSDGDQRRYRDSKSPSASLQSNEEMDSQRLLQHMQQHPTEHDSYCFSPGSSNTRPSRSASPAGPACSQHVQHGSSTAASLDYGLTQMHWSQLGHAAVGVPVGRSRLGGLVTSNSMCPALAPGYASDPNRQPSDRPLGHMQQQLDPGSISVWRASMECSPSAVAASAPQHSLTGWMNQCYSQQLQQGYNNLTYPADVGADVRQFYGTAGLPGYAGVATAASQPSPAVIMQGNDPAWQPSSVFQLPRQAQPPQHMQQQQQQQRHTLQGYAVQAACPLSFPTLSQVPSGVQANRTLHSAAPDQLAQQCHTPPSALPPQAVEQQHVAAQQRQQQQQPQAQPDHTWLDMLLSDEDAQAALADATASCGPGTAMLRQSAVEPAGEGPTVAQTSGGHVGGTQAAATQGDSCNRGRGTSAPPVGEVSYGVCAESADEAAAVLHAAAAHPEDPASDALDTLDVLLAADPVWQVAQGSSPMTDGLTASITGAPSSSTPGCSSMVLVQPSGLSDWSWPSQGLLEAQQSENPAWATTSKPAALLTTPQAAAGCHLPGFLAAAAGDAGQGALAEGPLQGVTGSSTMPALDAGHTHAPTTQGHTPLLQTLVNSNLSPVHAASVGLMARSDHGTGSLQGVSSAQPVGLPARVLDSSTIQHRTPQQQQPSASIGWPACDATDLPQAMAPSLPASADQLGAAGPAARDRQQQLLRQEYSRHQLVRLSIKLHGVTPDQLPGQTVQAMQQLLVQQAGHMDVVMMQPAFRQGCVQMELNLLLKPCEPKAADSVRHDHQAQREVAGRPCGFQAAGGNSQQQAPTSKWASILAELAGCPAVAAAQTQLCAAVPFVSVLETLFGLPLCQSSSLQDCTDTKTSSWGSSGSVTSSLAVGDATVGSLVTAVYAQVGCWFGVWTASSGLVQDWMPWQDAKQDLLPGLPELAGTLKDQDRSREAALPCILSAGALCVAAGQSGSSTQPCTAAAVMQGPGGWPSLHMHISMAANSSTSAHDLHEDASPDGSTQPQQHVFCSSRGQFLLLSSSPYELCPSDGQSFAQNWCLTVAAPSAGLLQLQCEQLHGSTSDRLLNKQHAVASGQHPLPLMSNVVPVVICPSSDMADEVEALLLTAVPARQAGQLQLQLGLLLDYWWTQQDLLQALQQGCKLSEPQQWCADLLVNQTLLAYLREACSQWTQLGRVHNMPSTRAYLQMVSSCLKAALAVTPSVADVLTVDEAPGGIAARPVASSAGPGCESLGPAAGARALPSKDPPAAVAAGCLPYADADSSRQAPGSTQVKQVTGAEAAGQACPKTTSFDCGDCGVGSKDASSFSCNTVGRTAVADRSLHTSTPEVQADNADHSNYSQLQSAVRLLSQFGLFWALLNAALLLLTLCDGLLDASAALPVLAQHVTFIARFVKQVMGCWFAPLSVFYLGFALALWTLRQQLLWHANHRDDPCSPDKAGPTVCKEGVDVWGPQRDSAPDAE